MTKKEKSPWIRVSEQLPPEGEEVLVRLKNYNYSPRIMFYRKRDNIWVEECDVYFDCYVDGDDLWMPIPDLEGWIMEYDQTQIFIIRGLNDCSIHFSFTDDGLSVSVFTRNGLQGEFYFNEITLKVFAYAYKMHCEKIRELNEKERNS